VDKIIVPITKPVRHKRVSKRQNFFWPKPSSKAVRRTDDSPSAVAKMPSDTITAMSAAIDEASHYKKVYQTRLEQLRREFGKKLVRKTSAKR